DGCAAVGTAYNTDLVFFHARSTGRESHGTRSVPGLGRIVFSVKPMFSFFKRKKAPAPQESVPAQSGIPGAPEVQDAPEVAPVAPTELPPGATASGAVVPDAVPPEMPLRAAEPVSEFTDGAGPAPAGVLTQPPDAWSDRPDETSDPLA